MVHTFFESADLLGGLVAKLSGVPVVISSRRDMGILRSTRHRIAYRLMSPLFNQVQAVSDAVREETIRADRISPHKVVTIPNGIEVEKLGRRQRLRGLVCIRSVWKTPHRSSFRSATSGA